MVFMATMPLVAILIYCLRLAYTCLLALQRRIMRHVYTLNSLLISKIDPINGLTNI